MSWKRPDVLKRMSVFLQDLTNYSVPTVLDIGTGDGVFSRLLLQKYPRAFIIQSDIRHYLKIKDHFIFHNVEAPPYRTNSIDLILLAQVLHYVPHKLQNQVIHRLLSLLPTDGTLLIIEYDTNSTYSWLPYPVSANRIAQLQISEGYKSKIIHDNDTRRPKYGYQITKV